MSKKNKYFVILSFIALFHIFIKLFLTLPFPEPLIFGDELCYKENARWFFELTGNKIHQHPPHFTSSYAPLYSFFLAFSFFSNHNFYFWMKVINTFISSLLIIPVWLISRLYLTRKKSFYPVLISILLPFHYSSPKFIMSENLFYPLFLVTMYFFLKARRIYCFKKSIISGIFIGLCLLTRYYAIILLPVLSILWWLPNNKKFPDKKKATINKLIHFSIIILSSLLISLPWILSAQSSFYYNFTAYLKGNLNRGQFQTGSFYEAVSWFLLYLGYFFLMISPVLGLTFWISKNFFKKILRNKEGFFFTLVTFITLAFLLMAMRHSSFGRLFDSYIVGRYLTYLNILWIIYAFINIRRLEYLKNNKKNLSSLILGSSFSVLLITLSYLAIINGSLWQIPPWFIMEYTSPDVFIFKTSFLKAGVLVWLYVCLINLGLIFFWRKMSRYLSFIVFLLTAIFFIVSDFKLQVSTLSWNKKNKITGRDIFLVLEENYAQEKNIKIYNNTTLSNSHLSFSLRFFGADEKRFEIITLKDLKEIPLIKERGMLITNQNIKNLNKLKTE